MAHKGKGTEADHQSGKNLSVFQFRLCKWALFGLFAHLALIHPETSAEGSLNCLMALIDRCWRRKKHSQSSHPCSHSFYLSLTVLAYPCINVCKKKHQVWVKKWAYKIWAQIFGSAGKTTFTWSNSAWVSYLKAGIDLALHKRVLDTGLGGG